MAPEWISGTAITANADVFSYRMMLFEIISQKSNVEHGRRCVDSLFPILVANKIKEANVHALLDADLRRGATRRSSTGLAWLLVGASSKMSALGRPWE